MLSPKDFTFKKELGCGSWSTLHCEHNPNKNTVSSKQRDLWILLKMCSQYNNELHRLMLPVMEAIHVGTSKSYAVKILSKSQLIKQKKVKYANVEKDALVKLSGTHPGIVKMHAAFQDETSLYFVLDLAPHGDLADLVKKYGSLSLRCARWYAAQVVDAVLWIHSKRIVHRDVKPENMLLDSELRIKLTDFGSAYIAPDGDISPRSSTFVGSAAYVSPELLDRTSKTTSNSSDIWAIGCTLFFMIAGTPPFVAINDYQSFRKIEALDYTFPDNFYESAKDLVQQLLVLDPSDRLGVEPKSSPSQLRDHAFFAGASADHAGHDADSDMPLIRWDSLWTESPVPPETGIVQPRPSSISGGDDEDSVWENVVHEFSLVNVRSPSGGPLSPLDGAPSAPVDVPPGAVPCEVVETIPPDQQGDGAATAPADEGEHTDDAALKAKDWTSVVPAGETVRRMASVKTPIRKGLVKQPRACALLLTDRPRVLCVSLDDKHHTPKLSNVKHSLELRPRANGGSSPKSPKTEVQDVVVACRAEDAQNKLVLQTGKREYVYDFSDNGSLAWWAKEVSSLLP